ncbi:MAG: sulfatase [Myxococcota bacterium]
MPASPRPSRRAPARLLCAALGVALACAACGRERAPRTLLLVTFDTLRADFVGAYGGALAPTPALDALAREGAVFERAIAAAPSTIPSHATLMTGLPARRHSAGARNGDTRLEGATTVAERLAAAGWRTGAFVSNAVLQRRSGLDRGFAHYDERLPETEGTRLLFERLAPDTVAAALAWLAAQDDADVFLWVHLQDPHGPYTPPREWLERVPPVEGGAAARALPASGRDNPRDAIPAYQVVGDERTAAQYVRRYAAEIGFADAAFGELARAVRARGEAAIVATADHGESLGEGHFWFQHGQATTPELARVPLVVVAPGIAPQRRGELVGHVDVAPTLLALAGVAPSASASAGAERRGLALVDALRSGAPLPERTLFCDGVGETSAYRLRSWVRASGFGARSAARAAAAFDAGDRGALHVDGARAPATGGEPGAGGGGRADGGAGGRWEPGVDAALVDEIAAYLRDEVDVAPASMSPETLERLRALGYLGDESAARSARDGGAADAER